AERLVGAFTAMYVELLEPADARRAGAPPNWKAPWRCLALCSIRAAGARMNEFGYPVFSIGRSPGRTMREEQIFRLYFVNESAMIVAAEGFSAENDVDALAVARLLTDACSDECCGFELWETERLVAKQRLRDAGPAMLLSEISARMQESVLEREEAIRNSRWQIAQSRKLLARIAELRGTTRARSGPVDPPVF